MKEMKSKGLYAGSLIVLLLAVGAYFWLKTPAVVVAIGEPWETTQQRSTVKFTRHPDSDQLMLASSNARLHLLDPKFGFVTQIGRDITIYNNEKGQIETVGLLLGEDLMSFDQAVQTATELQGQMRKLGWTPFIPRIEQPIADTTKWREYLRQNDYSSLSLWIADRSYKATIFLHKTEDSAPGLAGRYVLGLHIDPMLKKR